MTYFLFIKAENLKITTFTSRIRVATLHQSHLNLELVLYWSFQLFHRLHQMTFVGIFYHKDSPIHADLKVKQVDS